MGVKNNCEKYKYNICEKDVELKKRYQVND